MWEKESTYVERTDGGPRSQEGCAQSEQRRADGGGRPLRRGGARMKRSFPPRFYRERRETYLHYRFLRKRGRFLARSGEDGRPESVWIARERGKTSARPWDPIRRWLGVTSMLYH